MGRAPVRPVTKSRTQRRQRRHQGQQAFLSVPRSAGKRYYAIGLQRQRFSLEQYQRYRDRQQSTVTTSVLPVSLPPTSLITVDTDREENTRGHNRLHRRHLLLGVMRFRPTTLSAYRNYARLLPPRRLRPVIRTRSRYRSWTFEPTTPAKSCTPNATSRPTNGSTLTRTFLPFHITLYAFETTWVFVSLHQGCDYCLQ